MKYTAEQFRTGEAFFIGSTNAKKITAIFRNGREIPYTMDIYDDLKDDPDVSTIYDSETGEVIYFSEQ